MVKNKTARTFMLLASVLMLKICFGQSMFSVNTKVENKSTIHASNHNNTSALNIANAEFDEDETEENNTKDLFIELPYLTVCFGKVNLTNNYLHAHQLSYTYPLNLAIFKAVNCFRI
ncbi:MAG: hypothetical protein ACEQSR_09965 [Candidatus Methylacidiphilales bacterium]